MAVLLETILTRQKEVFDMFIANNGREVALQPLIKQYSFEDDTTYPHTIIRDYLKMYISSLNATEEDIKKYKKASTISDALKIKRGKEIVERLIENNVNWSEMSIFAKRYAIEDGKFRSYESHDLHEWKRLFLTNNTDKDLDTRYRKAVELKNKRKKSGYDLELLKELLEYQDIDKAKDFIISISISNKSITELLNAYIIIYPNNVTEITYLREAIEKAFENTQPTGKFVQNNKVQEKKQQRLLNFKNMIEEYVISDIEKIEVLFDKYNYTSYQFEETLKDMEATTDNIMRILLDNYEAKLASIAETRRNEVERIIIGITYGVCYGEEYQRFNMYDLKMITDMSNNDIKKYAHKYFTPQEYKLVTSFLDNQGDTRYKTRDELFSSINYGRNGRMVTEEEKWLAIEYMESNNWGYSSRLLMDILKRYMDNNITLSSNTDEIEIKMNK